MKYAILFLITCGMLLGSDLLANQAMAQQKAMIEGKVLDQDGKPMPKAQVSLTRPNRLHPITTVEVAEDGSYSLPTDERGFVLLQYCGVDHAPYTLGTLLTDSTQTSIVVQLQPYSYRKTLDSIRVVGDFNGYSFYDAPMMTKGEDGRYTVVIATSAPSITYQLAGLTEIGLVNAPGAPGYQFDGNEGYRSIAYAEDGKITITFDTAALVRSKAKTSVAFSDSTLGVMAKLYGDIAQRREKYQQALTANRVAGRSINEFSYNWRGELNKIAQRLAMEQDTLLRSMLLVSYLDMGTLGAAKDIRPAIAKSALATIHPASPLWSINPRLINLTIERTGEPDSVYQEYVAQAIDQHQDPNVTSMLLYDRLTVAYTNKETARARDYYERLTRDYGSSRYAAMARVQFVITRDEASLSMP